MICEPDPHEPRSPWPVYAAGTAMWAAALAVTAVVVAADRLASRFLNGGN